MDLRPRDRERFASNGCGRLCGLAPRARFMAPCLVSLSEKGWSGTPDGTLQPSTSIVLSGKQSSQRDEIQHQLKPPENASASSEANQFSANLSEQPSQRQSSPDSLMQPSPAACPFHGWIHQSARTGRNRNRLKPLSSPSLQLCRGAEILCTKGSSLHYSRSCCWLGVLPFQWSLQARRSVFVRLRYLCFAARI